MSTLPTDYDGHVMRTPAEWCRIKQIEILDADGWRGIDAKDWAEPLTELDFEERAMVCTQRSIAVCSDCSALPGRDHSPSCLTQLTTQPAGPHHTGTLNLTGEGNEAESVSPISDEAVKKAAWVFAEHRSQAWETYSEETRADLARSWEPTSRAALTAAMPALRRQIAEEIAAKGDEIAEQYQATAVEHRRISLETGSAEPKGQRHLRTAHAFRNKADGAWAVAHAARETGDKA